MGVFLRKKPAFTGTPTVIPPGPQTGLIFLQNNAVNSDIEIRWSGANMVSRTTHTIIWKANYTQQTGYYATAWHSQIIPDTFPASVYEYGTHPFPSAAGAHDGNGQCIDGTGSVGTVHYYEIAGLGASDFICTAGGSPLIVTKGTWVLQARTCEIVSGTILRHTFYPDLTNFPAYSIVQDNLVANLPGTPTNPCFQFACSPWRADHPDPGKNDETPFGTLRGFAQFSARLNVTDIQTEGNSDSNSPQTSAGSASVWYINKNPTPSDVSDKSGAGHSPSYTNSNRPTQYNNP